VADDVCRDPEDMPVVGTALAAEEKLLINVDKDLLSVGEYLVIEGARLELFLPH
jgi:predicted nucleic acid-binding protein